MEPVADLCNTRGYSVYSLCETSSTVSRYILYLRIPEIEKIIRQTKQKLKYEYPDRDTASSLILQDIFNMGDVRHREKLKIYRESLNLKMQGMTIEQTAAHLGKKSRYIYKLIHNRRIGAYLNEQQKTALKYVSELATIISAPLILLPIFCANIFRVIQPALMIVASSDTYLRAVFCCSFKYAPILLL